MGRAAGVAAWAVWGLGLAASLAGAQPAAEETPASGDRVRTVVAKLDGAVGGVAVDRLGLIYVADFGETVFKITPDGRVSVFATGLYGASGNAIDSKGNLLQSSFHGDSVSRIDRHGRETVLARGLNGPVGIAVDPDDGLVVCNCRGNSLSRISAGGEVSPFVQSDLLSCPNGITRAPDGHYYVVNFNDGRMLRVSVDGGISLFATLPGGGNGHVTFASGLLYATSLRGHRVFRVALDGQVTPLAGTGTPGETDGPAREATFTFPNGIAAGPRGDRLFVNDFVNRFPPTVEAPPRPVSSLRQITFQSFASRLTDALGEGGIEAMTRAYRAWKADPGTGAAYTELDVNALGYRLMAEGQLQAAIALFKLNVESYPRSSNVYDSLGEAYMTAGEQALAIASYEKSLELDPGNANAKAKLKKLRGGAVRQERRDGAAGGGAAPGATPGPAPPPGRSR